ncbi:hypothetical protein EZV62_001637 [Acer yangbiense]|uniref:Elongation factor P C-terminal domain-containing protein n=1 Tax=Acer yangbiense TaxID=1000413 RepID=A0A5C7IVF7_9ROSI|nr:hypothetical protein EZV62_001637 [Acer yangbiense]
MRALEASRRLSRAFFTSASYSRLELLSSLDCHISSSTAAVGNGGAPLLRSPWSATQNRGVKVNASHVLESEHKQRGRGGAMMQLELRDVDTGNKVSLRFGTEEAVESSLVALVLNGVIFFSLGGPLYLMNYLANSGLRVFVQEKSFTLLYTEHEVAYLIESNTFEQVEVPLDLFGKAAAYLKDEMKVTLQLYDGKPLSASIPKRSTCTIKEVHANVKGQTVTPRYTRALLDNGLTILVPSYLESGEVIFVNTEDDSYIGRGK